MGKAVWKVFKGKDEQWYFNLVAGNGEVVCSSEGYTEKHNALKGIESIRENCNAEIVFEDEDE